MEDPKQMKIADLVSDPCLESSSETDEKAQDENKRVGRLIYIGGLVEGVLRTQISESDCNELRKFLRFAKLNGHTLMELIQIERSK